jgi:hypothetical protein
MSRAQLKRLYNLAIAAALLVGVGVGYWLKGSGGSTGVARTVPAGAADKAFPGCRPRYAELKQAFAYGPYVRTDYADVTARLESALKKDPGYLPYHSLQARIHEDWSLTASREGLSEEDRAAINRQLNVPAQTPAAELSRAARKNALEVWERAGQYALCRDVATYGPQWRAIRDQNLSALRDRRDFRVARSPDGALDLVEVYNLYGITRDHERYPSNLSLTHQGFTFEEKHLPDILYCPQHPKVPFHLPCVEYLPSRENTTIREEIGFFRTVFGVDGQKLDLDDAEVKAVHLLCFSVTPTGVPAKAVVQLAYSGGREEARPIVVGPWRESDALLRDAAARRQLDPAYRDTEMHKCNGEELEFANAPVYMYHVTVPCDARARLDRISFPRYDPTSTGLEDPGIRDVRIVAITLE